MDISLKQTGIAIYNLDKRKFVFVDSFNTEKIYATKENKGLHLNAVKLKKIANWLKEIILTYPPSLVSIERMFSRFPKETQVIAKATGVVQCLLWNKPQYLYPPKTVKAEIFHGDATKAEVQTEIKKRIDYIEFNNDDESDAVAVALCHLIKFELIEWEKSKKPTKTKKSKKSQKK